ncbi:MAG TPA: PAS domain S-box protein [Candidatus Omnitrophota bacterium]|nr:PAS domain S-box protein [Candidatus Omnitrophota bacterium]HPT39146.1 PAS domain S-box protein [Candidatus Omnitrophota bacterium]
MKPAKKKFFLIVLISVFIVLTVGIIYIGLTAHFEDKAMRDDLLLHAKLIKNALGLQAPLGLTASDEDLSSPDYQLLKSKLMAISAAYPECRFTYLFGKHQNGKVFFYIDSESPDSQNYSPPGQIYNEASDDLLEMFSTGEPLIEGPETDRWGTWISALVPVVDPQTNKVMAVLGMDIDIRQWGKSIFFRVFISFCVYILILALIGLFLFLSQKSRNENLRLKKIQMALQDSENKYHGLFLSFPDAMIIFRPSAWKFYSGNPAMFAMFGIKDEKQLLSLRADELYPERQPDGSFSVEKAKEAIETTIHQGSRYFEFTHRRLNGQEFPSTVLMARMELSGEVMIQMLIRDITQKKIVEDENIRRTKELEVFYKVSMGREERIIELKKEVERLNKDLKKLSGNLSV